MVAKRCPTCMHTQVPAPHAHTDRGRDRRSRKTKTDKNVDTNVIEAYCCTPCSAERMCKVAAVMPSL